MRTWLAAAAIPLPMLADAPAAHAAGFENVVLSTKKGAATISSPPIWWTWQPVQSDGELGLASIHMGPLRPTT